MGWLTTSGLFALVSFRVGLPQGATGGPIPLGGGTLRLSEYAGQPGEHQGCGPRVEPGGPYLAITHSSPFVPGTGYRLALGVATYMANKGSYWHTVPEAATRRAPPPRMTHAEDRTSRFGLSV